MQYLTYISINVPNVNQFHVKTSEFSESERFEGVYWKHEKYLRFLGLTKPLLNLSQFILVCREWKIVLMKDNFFKRLIIIIFSICWICLSLLFYEMFLGGTMWPFVFIWIICWSFLSTTCELPVIILPLKKLSNHQLEHYHP